MSRIFSTSSGSGDTLKASSRQGLSPNARQISPTVVWEIPWRGGQAPGRPVRRVRRGGLEGLDHDRLHHVVADRAGRAGAGRVHQPIQPLRGETVPPLGHRRRVAAHRGGDLVPCALAVGAGQHDPAPQRQRLGRGMASRPALQRLALLPGEVDLDGRSSAACHGAPPMLVDNTRPTRHHRQNSRCRQPPIRAWNRRRWWLASRSTTTKVTQDADLCDVVDVLGQHRGHQMRNREHLAPVRRPQVEHGLIVQTVDGRGEPVLRPEQPAHAARPITGDVAVLDAGLGTPERPVQVHVGPRREVDDPPRNRRDGHRLRRRPAVLAHPASGSPAGGTGPAAPHRPAARRRLPPELVVSKFLEDPAGVHPRVPQLDLQQVGG